MAKSKKKIPFVVKWRAALIAAHNIKPAERMALLALQSYASSKSGKCFPSAKTISSDVGLSLATVRRSWISGVDAGLLTIDRHFTKSGRQTSNRFTLTIPERVAGSLPRQGVTISQDRDAPITQDTPTNIPQGQRRVIDSRTQESSIAGHTVSASVSNAAAPMANEQTTQHEEQGMADSKEDMMRAFHAPIQDHRPQVPAAYQMTVTNDRQRANEVTITDHRVAWRANNGEQRHWREGWTPWLMQFLPYMTSAMHAEWMAEMMAEGNVPRLQWQHDVALRLLRGEARVKRGERAPRFGAATDESRFGRQTTDDRFNGGHS